MSNTHVIKLEEYIRISDEVDRLKEKLKAAEAEIERCGQIMEMMYGHLDEQGQKWASEWFDSMGNVKPHK